MYYDSTLQLLQLTRTKTGLGAPEFEAGTGITVPCYVAHVSGQRDVKGSDGVMYDALAYIPYNVIPADTVVVYDGNTYDIAGVFQVQRRHHLELGLKRRQP